MSCGCKTYPIVCKTSAPYPDVTGVCKSEEAVRLLKMDYASAKSELSALHSYMYQHAILLACYPEIADTLECIAKVEMNHVVLLQKAVIALGGDPRYHAQEGTSEETEYWDARHADYSQFIKDIIQRDIAGEEEAIAQYTQHASVIPMPKVSALLLRIADDERLHVTILQEILAAL